MKLTWRSVDPQKNRFRWYSLETSQDLWGKPCVVCRWGRLGQRGGRRIEWYASPEQREKIIASVQRIRARHGYTPTPHLMP